MAITFRLPSAHPLDLVRFGWSPLFEAVLSLRAVNQPKRTPMFVPWARRCRDLPEDLRDELATLFGGIDGCIPCVFEVGFGGRSLDFADELAAFRAIDDDVFVFEMTMVFGGMACGYSPEEGASVELVHDERYRTQVLDAAGDQRDLVELLFAEPAALRARFADVLERYWMEAFAEEWDRLQPRIEAEIADGARALVTEGVGGLVDELLPEASWDAEATAIVVDKPWDGECDIAERGGLFFVPTWYGWPCVLIELAPSWPVAIFHPLREMRHPQVPTATDAEVADGFRAIGDETRLQIARLVAETPRSTTELAELLSLSDSAISRHLKILDAAGLVKRQRDGYFVLYSLDPTRLDVLGGALRSTLGLARGTRGGAVPALPVSMPRSGHG